MTWWRRQRVPLIALLIAAVAVVGVHVWLDVLPASERSTETITVAQPGTGGAADLSAQVAGQTLTLESTRWDEFDAPDGSRTLSIRLDARAGADATTCGVFTLGEVNGSRSWENARSVLDVPLEAGESGCQEDSAPVSILAVFLLPDDAEGPFRFDVPGEGGEIARFPVQP